MSALQHPCAFLPAEWKCPWSGGSFAFQSDYLFTDPLAIGRCLLPDRSYTVPGRCSIAFHIYPLLDLQLTTIASYGTDTSNIYFSGQCRNYAKHHPSIYSFTTDLCAESSVSEYSSLDRGKA